MQIFENNSNSSIEVALKLNCGCLNFIISAFLIGKGGKNDQNKTRVLINWDVSTALDFRSCFFFFNPGERRCHHALNYSQKEERISEPELVVNLVSAVGYRKREQNACERLN